MFITDNMTQFDNNKFREFLADNGTKILYAFTAHPQTNGQTKAIDKLIKQTWKKKLEDAKGLWAKKLQEVLWALRTTATEANGESPFFITFGTEAVIPVAMEVPSDRVNNFGPGLNLDQLEERWEQAHLHNINKKQKIAKHYNSRVIRHPLVLGDLVMKEVI